MKSLEDQMKRLYRQKDNVLVYLDQKADSKFWDQQWESNKTKFKKPFPKNSYVSDVTKKYLKKDSIIIEGGCGRANHVYSLQNNNFKCIGIDFAENTVNSINKEYPDLDVRLGDIRKLDIDSDSIDGYWSLGVIEHFYDGYYEIAKEIKRVLKQGGYLFLTFPTMNYLRNTKARFGIYENLTPQTEVENFYQYCLDSDGTIEYFESLGMKLVKKSYMDGYKGLKDESPEFLRKYLQLIYDSNHLFAKIVKYAITKTMSWYCGHSCLIIFRKI